MNISDNFLRELFPININQSYKNKKLAIELLFFKVTSSFPQNEIKEMKQFQIEFEKDKMSLLLLNKPFENLEANEKQDLLKILKKRSSTPIKTTHYLRFLVKSILKTLNNQEYTTIDKTEPILKDNNQAFFCTFNKMKNEPNSILFNEIEIFDSNDLFTENVVLKIVEKIPVNFNNEKVVQLNQQINEIRSIYIELYNHEVKEKKEFMPIIKTILNQTTTANQSSEISQKD